MDQEQIKKKKQVTQLSLWFYLQAYSFLSASQIMELSEILVNLINLDRHDPAVIAHREQKNVEIVSPKNILFNCTIKIIKQNIINTKFSIKIFR